MLSPTTTLRATITLDLPKDSWSAWHQALKLLCFTKFGVAAQQILSDTLIPLQPFAIEPTKLDLDLDLASASIPGQLTCSRRSLTAEEAALPPIDPISLPKATPTTVMIARFSRMPSDASRTITPSV